MPVVRPVVAETTALGAAYAAGLAVGFWSGTDDLRRNWQMDRQWEPAWSADRREAAYRDWKRAVDRSLDWVEPPHDHKQNLFYSNDYKFDFPCPRHTMVNVRRDVGLVGTVIFIVRLQDG